MMQQMGPMVEQMLGGMGGGGGPMMGRRPGGGGPPGGRARGAPAAAMTPAEVKALLNSALPKDEAKAWGEMIIRDGVKMAREGQTAAAPRPGGAGLSPQGGAAPDFGAIMQQMGPMMESLLGPRPSGGGPPSAPRRPQPQQNRQQALPARPAAGPGGLAGTPLMGGKKKKKKADLGGASSASVSPELQQMLEGALDADEAKAWAAMIAHDEARMASGIGHGASVVRRRRM